MKNTTTINPRTIGNQLPIESISELQSLRNTLIKQERDKELKANREQSLQAKKS